MNINKINNGETRIQKVAKNMVWEMAQNIVLAIFPFLVRTVVIRYMGEEYLGLQSFCTSILEMLNLSNLGIDTALLSYIHKPIIEHNEREINRILSFFNKIYRYMGIVICVVALAIMPFLDKLIARDIPSGINIYIIFAIYLASFLMYYIITPASVFLLKALQQSYKVSRLITVCFVTENIIQIVLIVNGYYYSYIFMILVNSIVLYTMEYVVAKKSFPQYKYDKTISIKNNNEFIKDIISVFVYRVRDMSRNSADSVVISAILGLSALAKYQNYYMVMVIPKLLRDVLVNAATPSLGNFSASSEKSDVYRLYLHLLYIQLMMSGVVSIFYAVLVDDFVTIWLGKSFVLNDYIGLDFAIYLYVMGISSAYGMVRAAIGYWDKGKSIAVIETVTNVVLNVLLTFIMGLPGIIIATILSIVLINIPAESSIVLRKALKQNMKSSIMMIVKNIVWIAVTYALIYLMTSRLHCSIIVGMLIKCIVALGIMLFTYVLLYWRDEENKYLIQAMRNILHLT